MSLDTKCATPHRLAAEHRMQQQRRQQHGQCECCDFTCRHCSLQPISAAVQVSAAAQTFLLHTVIMTLCKNAVTHLGTPLTPAPEPPPASQQTDAQSMILGKRLQIPCDLLATKPLASTVLMPRLATSPKTERQHSLVCQTWQDL